MMASLKLIAAVMVALFAMGLGAEANWSGYARKPRAQGISADEMCREMMSAMNKLSPNEEADAEKTFALATSLFERFETEWGDAGRRLEAALAAVVHRSDCDESSLDIVRTIAGCNLWRSKSTKSLDEATKEYAPKCLTPDYISDKVNSTMSRPEVMYVTKLIDHQFFVDYASEVPEDKQMIRGSIEQEQSTRALAKAILRDPEVDLQKLKTEDGVYNQLKTYLFHPCVIFKLVMKDLLAQIFRVRFYLGGYEKFWSSLDEATREHFSLSQICKDLSYDSIKGYVSQKVFHHLQSASN